MYVAHGPLAPVLIPVFSLRPFFPYLSPPSRLSPPSLSLSPFFPLCFLSFSLVHVPSLFLGSFPLSATQHHQCLGAVTSSSRRASAARLQAERKERDESRKRKRGPMHVRTCACGHGDIYVRPTNQVRRSQRLRRRRERQLIRRFCSPGSSSPGGPIICAYPLVYTTFPLLLFSSSTDLEHFFLSLSLPPGFYL